MMSNRKSTKEAVLEERSQREKSIDTACSKIMNQVRDEKQEGNFSSSFSL